MEGRRFCFTLNNYTCEQFDQLTELCIKKGWRYIIGREIGANGTRHLQGYINFEKPFRPIQNKIFKEICGSRIHWEKCRGNEEQNYNYCSKDNNFVTNIEEPKKSGPKKKNAPEKWCNDCDAKRGELCTHIKEWIKKDMELYSPLINTD